MVKVGQIVKVQVMSVDLKAKRIALSMKALEPVNVPRVKHAPQTIVYVSCDLATFARDAKRLAAKGYQLLDVQPVDMFPQTWHIELVSTFKRV